MCTALNLNTGCHYFGRTLDLDRTYGEIVCVVPQKFPLSFKTAGKMHKHYAIIGMATVVGNIPLFYDAVNENGIAMAGLNFPGNAHYHSEREKCDNIAPFEFIPWILGQAKSLSDVKRLLSRINITDISFSDELPNSPLHWIISSKEGSVIVESMRDGVHVYESELGVLTNNPPYEYQISALEKYKDLRTDNSNVKKESENSYSDYSQGLGAVGLPGDVSSMSRFARAVFGVKNSVSDNDEMSSVSQFFHLLSSVEMTRGVCKTDESTLDITVYTSCINTEKCRYYYTTYDNRQISCVNLHKTEIDGDEILSFPLRKNQNVYYQN